MNCGFYRWIWIWDELHKCRRANIILLSQLGWSHLSFCLFSSFTKTSYLNWITNNSSFSFSFSSSTTFHALTVRVKNKPSCFFNLIEKPELINFLWRLADSSFLLCIIFAHFRQRIVKILRFQSIFSSVLSYFSISISFWWHFLRLF